MVSESKAERSLAMNSGTPDSRIPQGETTMRAEAPVFIPQHPTFLVHHPGISYPGYPKQILPGQEFIVQAHPAGFPVCRGASQTIFPTPAATTSWSLAAAKPRRRGYTRGSWLNQFAAVVIQQQLSAALDTNVVMHLCTPAVDHTEMVVVLKAFKSLVIVPQVMTELKRRLPVAAYLELLGSGTITVASTGEQFKVKVPVLSEEENRLAGNRHSYLIGTKPSLWVGMWADLRIVCEAGVLSCRSEFGEGILVLTNDSRASLRFHVGARALARGLRSVSSSRNEEVCVPPVVSCREAGLRSFCSDWEDLHNVSC